MPSIFAQQFFLRNAELERFVYSNWVFKFNKRFRNSFYIKGYDADAFMLKLNEELELPQPKILSKPLRVNMNRIQTFRIARHFALRVLINLVLVENIPS